MTPTSCLQIGPFLRRLVDGAARTHLAALWHLSRASLALTTARVGHVITRLQQRRWKSDATVWTNIASRSYLATPVEHFRATDAADKCLRQVIKALRADDIPHRVIGSPPEPSRVVVDDLPAALSAIGRSSQAWYARIDGRTAPARNAVFDGADSATVFRVWATHDGCFLAGRDVGVEVLTDASSTQPDVPNFPIDAVFTWVDGADPQWQQRKLARESDSATGLHGTAANPARYASFDELKYALRSIEMYAPWIRRIFLVTDRQVPTWLDVEDPRITVVDHREIFDGQEGLPTFNSHAIEARLHHIPDLAEHYVYFNDDVFLTRALPPSFFFQADGKLRVFLATDAIDAGPLTATDPPVIAAAKNNRELLRELTGHELHHKLKHVPHPQLKSVALELESRAPEPFRATMSAPFRSPNDLSIASSLLPHYALATGRGVPDSIRHFYADVASTELRWRLPALQETREVDIVCLNATIAVPEEYLQRVSAFLEKSLPSNAPWERGSP